MKHVMGRHISVLTLLGIMLVAQSSVAPFPSYAHEGPASASSPVPQEPSNNEDFPCENPKPPSVEPTAEHGVKLLWKASTSLGPVPATGDGYNVYRRNPDGSCTKVNSEPIRATNYEDPFVEPGKTYRYKVRAIKRGQESDPSNVADAEIPAK